MEWLGDLTGIFANVASGGVFGLIGSIVGIGAKYLQERQRQAWEREKWGHEYKLQELAMQQHQQETELEIALADTQGSWTGLSASLASDAAAVGGSPVWVKAARSLFRPVLTISLVVLVWFVWQDLLSAVQGADSNLLVLMTEAEAQGLLRYIIEAIVFAASTAIVWWFGERSMSPPSQKNA